MRTPGFRVRRSERVRHRSSNRPRRQRDGTDRPLRGPIRTCGMGNRAHRGQAIGTGLAGMFSCSPRRSSSSPLKPPPVRPTRSGFRTGAATHPFFSHRFTLHGRVLACPADSRRMNRARCPFGQVRLSLSRGPNAKIRGIREVQPAREGGSFDETAGWREQFLNHYRPSRHAAPTQSQRPVCGDQSLPRRPQGFLMNPKTIRRIITPRLQMQAKKIPPLPPLPMASTLTALGDDLLGRWGRLY